MLKLVRPDTTRGPAGAACLLAGPSIATVEGHVGQGGPETRPSPSWPRPRAVGIHPWHWPPGACWSSGNSRRGLHGVGSLVWGKENCVCV